MALRETGCSKRDLFERPSPAIDSVTGGDNSDYSPAPCHIVDLSDQVGALPTHLGWGSSALTAVLRRRLTQEQTSAKQIQTYAGDHSRESTSVHQPVCQVSKPTLPSHGPDSAPHPSDAETAVSLRVYPDIALGILRAEQTGPARVWYLLRHLDPNGCGWVEETVVRRHLTERNSPLRLCGQRQLRNLLKQGDGLFWERRNGRIWLRSLVKLAVALDVGRLQARPVAVPLTHFTAGMGEFRAHLYATFHSGRGNTKEVATPIARETLANLSYVPPRTQRLYERKAGVKKVHNFAIGSKVTTKTAQETGWQKGHALFLFTDHHGRHGAVGSTYLAWQLPNSYQGPHIQQQNGRQKRLNKAIADLLPIGMTGNGGSEIETRRQRRYCPDGKVAARLYNRLPQAFYWPARNTTGWWYATTTS